MSIKDCRDGVELIELLEKDAISREISEQQFCETVKGLLPKEYSTIVEPINRRPHLKEAVDILDKAFGQVKALAHVPAAHKRRYYKRIRRFNRRRDFRCYNCQEVGKHIAWECALPWLSEIQRRQLAQIKTENSSEHQDKLEKLWEKGFKRIDMRDMRFPISKLE